MRNLFSAVALSLGGPVPFLCGACENLLAVENCCENVMRATCFVHISILTGTNISVANYPG